MCSKKVIKEELFCDVKIYYGNNTTTDDYCAMWPNRILRLSPPSSLQKKRKTKDKK